MRLSRRLVTGRKALLRPPGWDLTASRSAFGLLPWDSREQAEPEFAGMIQAAYKKNGIIFALNLTRMLIFSEARFQYRQIRKGRPGDLFGGPALAKLERPWRGGTTGDLLARMIQKADLSGTAFCVDRPHGLALPNSQYMTIVLGSHGEPVESGDDLDAEVLAYVYDPRPGVAEPEILMPDEVACFAPIPDPDFRFRGMSWVTPVMDELESDQAATKHKWKYFSQGATGRMVVTVDKDMTPERFEKYKHDIDKRTKGASNAYKTLYLGGGADAKVVGADLKNLDFRAVQGAGETRVAAAAGVPPVIAGFSEGLQAATYSNYGQARRRFADGTLRPLWRNVAGSLASIVDVPADAELWYDDRDIAFLREDKKDSAEIQSTEAQTIRNLLDAGYTPESVTAAVQAGDWSLLTHTGLFSVQLQKPGETANTGTSAGGPNPAPPEE
ncbi:phage portal protein [Actinophytocola sp. NPDC049390]|uniref:phage portal protein n=1 Tax=Actinophytocola sp. NPDC049390 TaxID=3363894 RepID=UPI0037ACAA8B